MPPNYGLFNHDRQIWFDLGVGQWAFLSRQPREPDLDELAARIWYQFHGPGSTWLAQLEGLVPEQLEQDRRLWAGESYALAETLIDRRVLDGVSLSAYSDRGLAWSHITERMQNVGSRYDTHITNPTPRDWQQLAVLAALTREERRGVALHTTERP